MKYEVQIDIDAPRERVVELLDDPDNLVKWQRGLRKFETVEGEPGQKGAKSELLFDFGKRQMAMTETIVERDLPDVFSAAYDTKGVHNVVRNRFLDLGDGTTRWVSENEFQFGGMMKIVGFLMKSAFPKQSLKYMQDFKAFVEEGKDVRDD